MSTRPPFSSAPKPEPKISRRPLRSRVEWESAVIWGTGPPPAETEATALIVLDTDQHPVQAVEIELLGKRWCEYRRLDSPALERGGECLPECAGLTILTVGR